jgi:hypothetical protein
VLPNFLVIGAPKAGTTSLYYYLATHPEIFVSDPKELRFFIEEINWKKGLRWYEAKFARPSTRSIPCIRELPNESLGFCRTFASYLVRHPIERMRSQYRDRVLDRLEAHPIDVALREDPQYLDGSRYCFQLEQ